jgi:hypothetical protein
MSGCRCRLGGRFFGGGRGWSLDGFGRFRALESLEKTEHGLDGGLGLVRRDACGGACRGAGQMTRPALRGKRWLFYQAPSTRLASPAPKGASG